MTPSKAATSRSKRGSPARPPAKSAKLDEATRMAKALAHPLRARLLDLLNEKVASPNELATELSEPLGNVSYHVRALLELDCVELVDTAQRRGAVEHYYRATRRAMGDDEVWSRLPPSARRGFAVEWFKKAFADVSEAVDAGGLDARPDCHLSFTSLHLDEEAREQLASRMYELLQHAFELQAESLARQERGNGEPELATRLLLAQYEGAARAQKR